MQQTEFLNNIVFKNLKNLNKDPKKKEIFCFSEEDFQIILERAEHYGISIYSIETWKNKKPQAISVNEDFRKKATDPKWYKKAFLTFKTTEKKLNYSAKYKVSNKLLARVNQSKISVNDK
jgi:hypothetical protein